MSDSLADVGALIRANGDALRERVHQRLFEEIPPSRGIFPEDLSGAHLELPRAVAWVFEHSLDDESLPEEVTDRAGQMAVEHRRHGFPTDTYELFGTILADAVEAIVDKQVPSERVEAARNVLLALCGAMKEAADEADLAGDPPAHAGEISAIEAANDSVAIVHLESATEVAYEPGQTLPVMVPSRRGTWFDLAPAAPSNRFGQLEFHVGTDTPAATGEYWTIGTARGGFGKDASLDGARDLLLVAVGTGLAAVKSLVFSLVEQPQRPDVHLIVSASTAADFYDLGTLMRFAKAHDWLRVTAQVDSSASSVEAIEGTELVPIALPLTTLVSGLGVWHGRDVYLSGPRERVNELATALQEAGAPEETIFSTSPEGEDRWAAPDTSAD